jgi:hypothetical protein
VALQLDPHPAPIPVGDQQCGHRAALVAATGRLADPSDVPRDDAHLVSEFVGGSGVSACSRTHLGILGGRPATVGAAGEVLGAGLTFQHVLEAAKESLATGPVRLRQEHSAR